MSYIPRPDVETPKCPLCKRLLKWIGLHGEWWCFHCDKRFKRETAECRRPLEARPIDGEPRTFYVGPEPTIWSELLPFITGGALFALFLLTIWMVTRS